MRYQRLFSLQIKYLNKLSTDSTKNNKIIENCKNSTVYFFNDQFSFKYLLNQIEHKIKLTKAQSRLQVDKNRTELTTRLNSFTWVLDDDEHVVLIYK